MQVDDLVMVYITECFAFAAARYGHDGVKLTGSAPASDPLYGATSQPIYSESCHSLIIVHESGSITDISFL